MLLVEGKKDADTNYARAFVLLSDRVVFAKWVGGKKVKAKVGVKAIAPNGATSRSVKRIRIAGG